MRLLFVGVVVAGVEPENGEMAGDAGKLSTTLLSIPILALDIVEKNINVIKNMSFILFIGVAIWLWAFCTL